MQCKSCNTELPKHAKVCPKCGTKVNDKQSDNIKVIAVAGLIIAMLGGLLPFVQNTTEIRDAYSYMNIDLSFVWYIALVVGVAGLVLLASKKDKLALIPISLYGVINIVAIVALQFRHYKGRTTYDVVSLTDLLSNGSGTDTYTLGLGFYVLVIGMILAVAGCFFDVLKYFKKESKVDKRFLSNSINKSVWTKIRYYKGFYIMFLPVLIFIILFNYLPMAGCRYAFTKFVIKGPYYVGLMHFSQMFQHDIYFWQSFRNTLFLSIIKLILNTGAAVIISLLLNEIGLMHFSQMFQHDIYFWQSFRNTLFLSIIKLILNTGAAVIISLLLNEIVNLAFKKTVQTIVYLPHFMSWVVVASVFKMILDPNPTGVVNSILLNSGLVDEPIFFLGDTKYWTGTFFMMNASVFKMILDPNPTGVVNSILLNSGLVDEPIFFLGDTKYWTGTFFMMNVWKDTGWGTILFLATLSGISPDLYEAAQIDGANRWKRLIYITFPALANTIITVFILNLAKVMNLFESVFVTMNAAVTSVADVLQTYIYSKTFGGGNSDYGYSTAVGLFKSFVGMILVFACNYASKKVRGRGIV